MANKKKRLSERQRWFVIGGQAFSFSRLLAEHSELSTAYRDSELIDMMTKGIDQILREHYEEPGITEEEAQDLARVIELTHAQAEKFREGQVFG